MTDVLNGLHDSQSNNNGKQSVIEFHTFRAGEHNPNNEEDDQLSSIWFLSICRLISADYLYSLAAN